MPAPGIISSAAFPWQDSLCYFFRLEYEGVQYAIREPMKWDAVGITGLRDKDWHGWNFQYSDGDIQMEFDCDSGKELLETAYNEYGNDAVVNFIYGYRERGLEVDNFLFYGKFNFNTYQRVSGRVVMAVTRQDFNDLLQSRIDTKVSMTAQESVDGLPLTPPTLQTITLHAKEINKRFILEESVMEGSYVEYESGSITNYYYHFNTAEAAVNEFEESFPFGASIDELDPTTVDLFDWRMKYDGIMAGTLSSWVTVGITRQLIGGGQNFTITPYLKVFRGGSEFFSAIIGTVVNKPMPPNTNVNYYYSFQINYTLAPLELLPGDAIYLYMHLQTDGGLLKASNVAYKATNFNLQILETTPASATNMWMIGEAVDHCIKVITNNTSRLKSDYLSLVDEAGDGEFSRFALTNGFQIRQFEVSSRPLLLALKTALTSIKAMAAIGMGFEYDDDDTEVVRIEPIDYFYQDQEIMKIEEIDYSSYKEEVEKSLIFNEIEVGYNKYKNDGFNTLDEFNTRHEYLTPIKTHKAKLVLKSDFIASGYEIEDVRRQQYAETPTDSYNNDEEPFIIAVRREGLSQFVPETNEAFADVQNLISPTTAYNLRLSPKRMLMAWFKWIGGMLAYKDNSERILNTFADKNGALSTEFTDAETRTLGDFAKAAVIENAHVTVEQLTDSGYIYTPETISFDCELHPGEVLFINECMRGQNDPTKNYGYLSIKQQDGTYKQMWLNKLSYNYSSGKCEMEGIKKWQ